MKDKRQLLAEFVLVFAIVLVVSALVILVWNVVLHGEARFDWGTSFVLATTFGVVFPLLLHAGRRDREHDGAHASHR